MRLELSRKAKADLDDIRDFGVERFGSARTDSYLGSVEAAFSLILRYPSAGFLHDRLGSAIRSVSCQSHRVLYEVIGERVVVQRILHKAMDIDRHL